MFITLLIAALSVAVAGDLLDVITTEKCIAKGAIETNTFLVGTKPSAIALYLRDSLMLAICTAPAVAASYVNLPLAYGLLAAPALYGVKHYLGYRAGKLWLAGKAPDPNAKLTAWQKFIKG